MGKERFAVWKKKQKKTHSANESYCNDQRNRHGKNNNKKDGRKFKIRYLNACCQQDNPFKNENIDELKIKNKSWK